MTAGSLGPTAMILHSIETPADVKGLNQQELAELCEEIRAFIVDTVTTTGGHLGSNLGAVELTLALHRVFDSPRDVILWDTGHQAYVHKLRDRPALRLQDPQAGRRHVGLPESGRVGARLDREQPRLDGALVRTRHRQRVSLRGVDGERRVVAVVGDGALTGGMAYEALNNLGHSGDGGSSSCSTTTGAPMRRRCRSSRRA